MENTKPIIQAVVFAFYFVISGCATTNNANDPLEGWNRGAQSFNDKIDQYALKPVAKGYQWIMPNFADQGITNFFSNINDISVTLNDLLQFKLKQTGMDGSRFLVNSTAGIGGLLDIASMIDLPKHNEDFDQTLHVWGVPSGPYLVLPLFGPSSPRGATGLVGDAAVNPATYIAGMNVLNVVDKRADNLTTEKILTEASVDRYEFIKNSYLQRRSFLVNDGNLPEGENDPLENPQGENSKAID